MIPAAEAIPAPNTHDLIVAFALHAGNHDDMLKQVIKATGPGWPIKPLVAYMDSGDPELFPAVAPSWLSSDRVWPSFAAYRNPNEPLDVFRFRCETILERMQAWGNYIVLTPAFYTRNKNPDGTPVVPVAQIMECMPLYEEWIRNYPICGVMPFADLRPSGMGDHPEFYNMARAFLDAIPANRPNRYDYWTPPMGAVESLSNKLSQDIDLVVLSRSERRFLFQKLVAAPTDPTPDPEDPPEEPPPHELMAPMKIKVVIDVLREHPEINMLDEDSPTGRARILDYVCDRLGGKPWGRKARREDGSHKNTDGLTWLRPDGKFEIYDVLNGFDPDPNDPDMANWASWAGHGPFSPGENGWWAPHEPV